MPLKSCGMVRARLRVWFSAASRAPKAARSAVITSIPPGSIAASASRPWSRWSEARRCVPASVSSKVPAVSNSNSASAIRPGGLLPGASHLRRPAIIRWITRKSSPSSARTIRLARRSTPSTRLPSATASGGTAVRTRNGFSTLIRCSRLPTTRRASRSA